MRASSRIAATCWSEGCDGIAMLGTTGEANSFSAAERTALLEAVVRDGIAPNRLSARYRRRRAQRYDRADASRALGRRRYRGDAAAILLQGRHRRRRLRVLQRSRAAYRRCPTARSCSITIPQMSAQPISHALIERLRAAYPATFVGIKDSSGDFANMTAMVERFPGFAVLGRRGSAAAAAAAQGRRGLHHRDLQSRRARSRLRLQAFPRQRRRRRARGRAGAHREGARAWSHAFPQMASLKALVAERTGHAGWQRLRPPLESLPAAHLKELLADAGASAAVA